MARGKALFEDYAGVARRLEEWCSNHSKPLKKKESSRLEKFDVAKRAALVAELCARRPQERELIDGRSTKGSWCFDRYEPASGHAANLVDRLGLFVQALEQFQRDVRDSRQTTNEVFEGDDTEAFVSNADGSDGGSGFAWSEHHVSLLLSTLTSTRNLFRQFLSRPIVVRRASTGRPSDTAFKCLLNGLHLAGFSDGEIAKITNRPADVVRTQIKRIRGELGMPPSDVTDRSICEAALLPQSAINLVTLKKTPSKNPEHDGHRLERLPELADRNGIKFAYVIYLYAWGGMRVAHKPQSVCKRRAVSDDF